MRPLLPVLMSALLAVPALAHADASRPKLSSTQCGLSTDYNVLVDGGGVWLYRDSGVPKDIFFHDGTLSVDRVVQPVSAADAQRLRRLEAESRVLMPQVANIARESVEITFDSLTAVFEALTGSRRKARRLDGHRKDALAHVDRTLGTGRWDQDVFGGEFETRIETAAESLSASLGRSVLWQVFTGGAGRMERRAERMEAGLEQRLEARAAALETKADALCAQVAVMDELQRALEYRHRGNALRMLETSRDAHDDGHGDRAPDRPVAVQAPSP